MIQSPRKGASLSRSNRGAAHGFKVLMEEISDNNIRHFLVRFPVQGGGTAQERIKRGLLFEPHKAKIFFADRGAELPDDCRELFQHLQQARPSKSRHVTSQAGWHQADFVTRFETLVGKGQSIGHVFDPSDPAASGRMTAGTWKEYVTGIAPLIAASDYVLLGMLLGLAAPLAARIGRKGGFAVILCGEGSTGKTLSIQVAHSLLTKANEEADLASFGDAMGATLNLLPAAGGTCLGFDDIKGDTNMTEAMQKLRTVVFSGTSAKSRKRSTEAPRPNPQFLIPFLSTERPLKELFEDASLSYERGEAVRALTIPVPLGDDGGIFAKQILIPSTQLAADLEQFLSAQYGTVLPFWIKQLVHLDTEQLKTAILQKERKFLQQLGSASMPGYQNRIAKCFAFVAAVGYIAIRAKLLRCSPDDVFERVALLFWETIFFLSKAEKGQKEFWTQFFQIVENGTILPSARMGIEPEVISKLGFRRQEKTGEKLYVRREELVKLLPVKFVDTRLLQALDGAGCLWHSEGEYTRIISQVGLPRGRYLVLDARLLFGLKDKVLTK